MALDWLLRPIFHVLILIFVLHFSISSSISDSESLINFKKSLINSTALSSWMPGSSPCADHKNNWIGVLCSNGSVIGLRLKNMGLSGKIDVDALANISGLRSLSIAFNSFSGSLPEFDRLSYLKGIYLTGNQFSGEIRSALFLKMEMLKKLWLSNNKITGEVPSSLMRLSNLVELHLENNQFTGNIPSIKYTNLKSFNVSNNKLRGEIPPCLSKFSVSSFEGNPELCGNAIGKKCNAVPSSLNAGKGESDHDRETRKAKGAGIITLAAMVLSVASVVILKMRRKEENLESSLRENQRDEVQVAMPDVPSDTALSNSKKDLIIVNEEKGVFELTDLMKGAAEVLGNGGLGSSYKVMIANSILIVVKRTREMNTLGRDAFVSEMTKLAGLCHPNILAPLAFHYRQEEKLLIYEFMSRGSLFHLLHVDRGELHAELTWPVRLKIIKGIARGLGYLHNELASSNLPHGNLKSSNIFMDSNNEPLLSEFGFNQLTSHSVAKQNLVAYKAPEAIESGVSPKCDVYCLGVIIFELLTGNHPSVYYNSERGGVDIVNWIDNTIAAGKEAGLLDPEIAVSSDSMGEMKALLRVGVHCANGDSERRLELSEAVQIIEDINENGDGSASVRTMQLLPSLRDGYADAPPIDWSRNVRERTSENSRRAISSGSFTDSSQFSFASTLSNFEHM